MFQCDAFFISTNIMFPAIHVFIFVVRLFDKQTCNIVKNTNHSYKCDTCIYDKYTIATIIFCFAFLCLILNIYSSYSCYDEYATISFGLHPPWTNTNSCLVFFCENGKMMDRTDVCWVGLVLFCFTSQLNLKRTNFGLCNRQ